VLLWLWSFYDDFQIDVVPLGFLSLTGVFSAVPLVRRNRRALQWSITLSVVLMVLNVTLMVCWIVLLAEHSYWSALAIGTVVFVLILVGLSFYLVLTMKEVRLNQRQANFIDSVTHELKSPIAALRLYLETLQMRVLERDQQEEFYSVMEQELNRLDHLISQLLEVGRLDAIGQQADPEDIVMEPLLRQCARTACAHHKCEEPEVFTFEIEPTIIHTRSMLLEMIFGNLMDNAIKYGGENPKVDIQARLTDSGKVIIRVADNGEGVPLELRKKIFQIFYRGGSELERRRKGTGLGLYIARTLIHLLKGKISVHNRVGQPGSVFEVELPGKAEPCES
jgi:signal transduction histidine kinase